ncbi:MAG: BlaI/MecI/CopY family transcriptional regulator [Taibaiella sp.]|nr:BlaI/MecI/CopY family transcriptional regulator [Taibaiella sp.]
MENEKLIRATEAELEILNILWAHGPSTVRDVHELLAEKKDAGYTTTLKQLQVMYEKHLVSREASGKSHIYTAAVDKQKTQGQIVQRLIDSVFNGSAMSLVLQALGNHKPTDAELDQIKRYLETKKKKK